MVGKSSAIDVGIVALFRKGPDSTEILIARRRAEAHLGGLWELPGGKCEPGESASSAARRELQEEIGVDAAALDLIGVIEHDYSDRTVRLHVFAAPCPTGAIPMPIQSAEIRWIDVKSIDEFNWPEANRSIMESIRQRLGS